MKTTYSLLLAIAITLLVMVYAYNPLYVVAYILLLAMMISSAYLILQWKHQHIHHHFRKETH